ncbi:PAS domain-containing protein [Ferrovibrio sp.]|uniref:PAS domain-containing protein n=1 Tax=Ferrovibrio sp. TaxID=1917215 RepID=UPI003D2A24C9
MDFVASLPSPLSSRSRDFLAIWNDWRRGRMLPEHRDMDLEALGSLAQTSLLLNVRGHDTISIDWVGEAVTQQLGFNLAGLNYLDLTSRENRSWRAHLTIAQVAQPCCAVIYYWLRLGQGGVLPVEIVSAPIRQDGDQHASLMLCSISFLTRRKRIPEGEAIDPDSYEEGEGMRFIDIGAGIPLMVPSQRQETRPVQ